MLLFGKVSMETMSVDTRTIRKSRDSVVTAPLQVPTNQIRLKSAAPEFTVPAVDHGNLRNISLVEFRGKYVVLLFYPQDFSFVCPTEIVAFSDRAQEFRTLNTEILACTIESQPVHLAWIHTPRKAGGIGEIDIILLADKNQKVARDYGALNEATGCCHRVLFIIDTNGFIRQMTYNDLSVGRSVDETLRIVQALQFTDEYGEVCPANWRPGFKTIKPDPIEKLEYFKYAF